MYIKARLSLQKGNSFIDRIKLVYIAAMTSRPSLNPLLRPFLLIFLRDGKIKANIRLPNTEKPVTVFFRKEHIESDYLGFCEVFLFNSYGLPLNFIPDLIIDGGGNIGYFTLMASQYYNKSSLVVIEPLDYNCSLIDEHLRRNNIKADILKGILSNHEGNLPFYIRNANNSSFDDTEPYIEVEKVMSFDILKIIDRFSYSSILIKLDIEGAEMEVIPRILPYLQEKNSCIVGELHDRVKHLSQLKSMVQTYNFQLETHDEDDYCLLFKIFPLKKIPNS